MRKIDLIVIHCSATRCDREFSVEKLIACHNARFGFTGYHYYVTRGLNEQGKPTDTRTEAQKATLWHLLKSLKVDYPNAKIIGHCELPHVAKDCPCFLASKEYAEL